MALIMRVTEISPGPEPTRSLPVVHERKLGDRLLLAFSTLYLQLGEADRRDPRAPAQCFGWLLRMR